MLEHNQMFLNKRIAHTEAAYLLPIQNVITKTFFLVDWLKCQFVHFIWPCVNGVQSNAPSKEEKKIKACIFKDLALVFFISNDNGILV